MHIKKRDVSSPEVLNATDLLKGHLGIDTRVKVR